MNNTRLKFFDGAVFHKRVGSKMHKFRYTYKSTFIEDVYDFNSESFLYAHSKILSFEKKYSDMSEKVIKKMKLFIKENFSHCFNGIFSPLVWVQLPRENSKSFSHGK